MLIRDIVYSGDCFQTSHGQYLGKYLHTVGYPAPSTQHDLVFEDGIVPYTPNLSSQPNAVDVKVVVCKSPEPTLALPKNNTNYGLGGRRRKTRRHKKSRKTKKTHHKRR